LVINKKSKKACGLIAQINVNTWEDQLVEESTSGWEAFHPRQPKPSPTPSLYGLPNGNA
jgi:hypothetical protein